MRDQFNFDPRSKVVTKFHGIYFTGTIQVHYFNFFRVQIYEMSFSNVPWLPKYPNYKVDYASFSMGF